MARKAVLLLLAVAALPLLLGIKGGEPVSISYRLARDAQPHLVAGTTWMVQNLVNKLQREPRESADLEETFKYFDLVRRHQGECPTGWQAPRAEGDEGCSTLRSELDTLGPAVERRIQRQVADAMEAQGLYLRQGPVEGVVPPVMFTFRSPPTLLVVSPRHRIEMAGRALLNPDLSLEEAKRLETLVSSRDLSAMVTRIGGLGVFPSILPENPDLQWVLQTVAHEWCHQYFAFQPLGWRYALGVETDRRMVAINETAAELIGREIGNQVYRRSYGQAPAERPYLTPRQLRFREQMRELRGVVEQLLKQGQVEEAEELMERRRQELNAEGYNLRVLNQAYFAFHGSYAEDPYLSGPEGEEVSRRVRWLREKAGSTGAFARAIATIGSYDELLGLTGG